jgi:thioredoxin-dependent peroxiredoxin
MSSFVQTAWRAYQQNVPLQLPLDGESFSTMPAEFLIDENLIVRKVHYAQRLNDRMDLAEVQKFIIG